MTNRIRQQKHSYDGANEFSKYFARTARPSIPALCLVVLFLQAPTSAQVLSSADEISSPLFSCETNRKGKFIQIRGIEEEPGKRWSAVQYSFGRSDEEPEMVYPSDPTTGAKLLFFSHDSIKFNYHVSIRFSTGGYTYRVFSYSDEGGAGVTVSDAKGKVVSRIRCTERPYMFAAYLQSALACDIKNPYGKAACGEDPYRGTVSITPKAK